MHLQGTFFYDGAITIVTVQTYIHILYKKALLIAILKFYESKKDINSTFYVIKQIRSTICNFNQNFSV